jgi:hypothetical protein
LVVAAEAKLAQTKGSGSIPQDFASAQVQLDSAKPQLEQTCAGTATAADIHGAQAQLKLHALKRHQVQSATAARRRTDLSRRVTRFILEIPRLR